MVMVRMVVKISIGVCWFSMNINRKFFIFACNYGIKECKSPVVFMFKGELYGRVNRVQGVMECCYSVLLNDGEAIIDKAFPGLGRHRCCFDCHFFDLFHAEDPFRADPFRAEIVTGHI